MQSDTPLFSVSFPFFVNFAPEVVIDSPAPSEAIRAISEEITIELTTVDPDGPPNLVLLDYRLEYFIGGGRERIEVDQINPSQQGANGDSANVEIEIDVGSRDGQFEFTVVPIDRDGEGTEGDRQTVRFFVVQ